MTRDDGRRTNRRTYLKAVGAGMIALAAGCSSNPEEPRATATPTETTTTRTTTSTTTTTEVSSEIPPELAERFGSIVNVEEVGGDSSGVAPINAILEEYLEDDTLFFFPDGTYKIDGLLVLQHHANVGLYGPEATLRPTDQQVGSWIVIDDVSDLHIEGLTVNNSATSTGVEISVSVTGGTNLIRNVRHIGFHDIDSRTHAFTLQVKGRETELTLENVSMPDGAANGTGIFVHPADDPGTLRLQDCIIENWYEQGLYGSPHGGPMYIVGGTYANNGKSQVRVGGGNADTRAEIRDVTVRLSDPEPADVKGNTRGIWLKEGENTLIENCDIEITKLSPAGSSGAIVIGPENGSCTIRDTTIRVDDQTFAIAGVRPKTSDFFTPSLEHPPENWDISIENVEVTGSASNGTCVWIADRPGSRVADLTIDQTGANRNGLSFVHSAGTEITGLSCSTTRYPIIVEFGQGSDGCALRLSDINRLEGTDVTPGSRVVPESDGTYCLTRNGSESGSDGVVGITNIDAEGLRVRPLSDDAVNPF